MLKKIINHSLTFIVILNLILTQEVAFALSKESNPELQLLLNEHLNLKSGVGSFDLLNKNGMTLKRATDKFISDPKNKTILETKDGRDLLFQNKLLNNYFEIKNHFEKCIKDKNSKYNLSNRILSASFQTLIETSLDCASKATSLNEIDQLSKETSHINNQLLAPNATKDIQKEILKNSFKSLLAFKFKFDPNFMQKKFINDTELNKMINENCFEFCNKISPNFERDLKNDLIIYSKRITESSIKLTPKTATTLLNQSIDKINNSLDKISIKKDNGIFFDSPEMKNIETQKSYQNYVNTYMVEASKDAGPLLLTDAIKDKSSELKSLDSSDTEKKKNSYRMEHHQKVEEKDVKAAIFEGEDKIKNQIKNTIHVSDKSLLKKDPIKELVKLNPIATGTILLKNPEYKNLICQSINQINQEDKNQEKFDRAFLIGTAVIGGALFLTGVGTVLGGYLLTGSLTAGIATGTTLGTVMIASTYVGMGIEGANILYQGSRAYDHYKEIENEEAAFLTKNTDSKSIELSKNALIEFKEARFNAGLSLAGLGISALSVGQFYGLFKNLDRLTVPEMKAITEIMNAINESKTGERLALITKNLGQSGTEKLDKFLYLLAKSSEEARIKFLTLLKNSNIPIEKLKNAIDDALLAAKNC